MQQSLRSLKVKITVGEENIQYFIHAVDAKIEVNNSYVLTDQCKKTTILKGSNLFSIVSCFLPTYSSIMISTVFHSNYFYRFFFISVSKNNSQQTWCNFSCDIFTQDGVLHNVVCDSN